METREPQYELSPELWRLNQATVENLNLFIRENKVTRSSDEALKSIIEDYKAIKKRHYDAVKSSEQFPSESPIEQVQDFHWKNTQLTILQLSNLSKRIDRCREISPKYNVPKLRGFKSLDSCVEATRSFMRVWRDEAEQRRATGERSLIEWIQELDPHKSATTFQEMRLAMIDIGNQISFQLCSYFVLINSVSGEREAFAGKIRAVEELLGCLIVEEKRTSDSVVIDRFKSLVKFVKTVLNVGDYYPENIEVMRLRWNESNLVASILREVLRFEAALNCPDLPMMLTDEVFLGMAMHMRDVFDKKLQVVSFELRFLTTKLTIGDQDPQINNLLDFGTKKIWDELDLEVRS